ncbi:MAG: lipoprotein NlpI [Rheinheimera sp.]|uniref:lipoprotein NlpI n=1 Tax=Arsukibacterium sp. UBA3155 TaxID=1946058 RepID=UPI000C89C6A8|nr:lipoprotein NlpI [Arsukibacterium sp. UBA3155]MAD75326.1 lipoprotein NlpI [Rheinheimera sp.]|tara:strand:+ start:146522 stop:147418 length:897 start_codon:yes stop_codon:yes gene_type:complete
MRRAKSGIAALLTALLTLSGCATLQPSSSAAWLTPEPLAVPYRTELAIARLSEILHRAELSEEQSARLYYDRGVMYDSAGLRSLARLDFMRALRLKPDMADAYNFVGIHYTLSGDFDQAFEAFDSVLELAPDYEYAYLNRGIALYYAGRADLAVPDFVKFLKLQSSDPYRVVWLYLAERDLSERAAKARLTANVATLAADDWATNIPRFYLGQLSEQQLLNSVVDDLTSPRLLAERLCEVYFYLAKWHEAEQQPEQAIEYYKKVLATNVYEFVEHRYARLEMARLRGEALSGESDEFH